MVWCFSDRSVEREQVPVSFDAGQVVVMTTQFTDYIRFYKFEPQTRGAEITQRNLSRAKYDASYRITANFLNWVIEKYDQDLLVQLNTIIREGKYNEEFWKKRTGHTVPELGDEWKTSLEKKLSSRSPARRGEFHEPLISASSAPR